MTEPTTSAPFARARYDFAAPAVVLADIRHAHILSIGGAGMSAVARLLLERGVEVSGTDPKEVPVLRALAESGASVSVGWDAAHVGDADTVIVSSAVRDDNPELVAARARGCRVMHRAQSLVTALSGVDLVAVAGANGKTTTSSLMVAALDAAGLRPGFAIGGELAGWGTNARCGAGQVAVVEADESDGSFVAYRPRVAVVTSVQPDHLDFYSTFKVVRAAYRSFAATVSGLLVVCVDDPGARELGEEARQQGAQVVGYGESSDADVRVTEVDTRDMGARAVIDGHAVRLQLPGRHNLANAAAVMAAATRGFGVDPQDVVTGLAAFSGTRRRFETIGQAAGVQVVDDYGHNVGKVQAAVRAAVELQSGRGRVLVIFQPHLYSRTRDFAAGLGAGLAAADAVFLLDIYGAREDPIDGVTSELVAGAVRQADPTTPVWVSDPEDAIGQVVAAARPGDLVMVLGAGDVGALAPRILARLAERV